MITAKEAREATEKSKIEYDSEAMIQAKILSEAAAGRTITQAYLNPLHPVFLIELGYLLTRLYGNLYVIEW